MCPPELLQQFEAIVPGSAKLLIEDGLKTTQHFRDEETQESQHRRDIERRTRTTADADIQAGWRARGYGQLCSLVLGLAAVAVAAYCVHAGAPLYAGAIIATVFAGGLLIRYISDRDHPTPVPRPPTSGGVPGQPRPMPPTQLPPSASKPTTPPKSRSRGKKRKK